MRANSMCVVLAIAVSSSGLAQVSPKYAYWTEQPEHFLMTKEEMKQWKTLRSDEEAVAFIDLFWARRDPTPSTVRNEFHEEFDRRVQFADNQFSSGRGRGALSDPGRAIILLGPPFKI